MKTEVISKVITSMAEELSQNQIKRLEMNLYTILYDYTITRNDNAKIIIGKKNNSQYYLSMFLSYKSIEGKSERTIQLYEMQLRKFFQYTGKSIENITDEDIIKYLQYYKQTNQVSDSYIHDIKMIINSFFGWAYNKRIVYRDVSKCVSNIAFEKKDKHPFSAEELEKIRRSCKNIRDKALVEFLYSTGARVTEVSKLNICDVDMNNKCVILRNTKSKKVRYTFLSEVSVMYLQDYLSSRNDSNPALFVGLKKPYGRLSKDGIERSISLIGQRAGVEICHPHRFRRTMATDLSTKGMPIIEVQHILGHSNLNTTMTYVDVDNRLTQTDHSRFIN